MAYCEMTFDGYKAPSVLEVEGAKDVAIEFYSHSKSYNMTGWRVGFVAGNADAVKALGTIKIILIPVLLKLYKMQQLQRSMLISLILIN